MAHALHVCLSLNLLLSGIEELPNFENPIASVRAVAKHM